MSIIYTKDMKRLILIILLLLINITATYGIDNIDSGEECSDKIIRPKLILFFSTSVFLMAACFYRFLKNLFNIPIPPGVFLLTLGVIIGLSLLRKRDILEDLYVEVNPQTLMIAYMVILIFRISFCIDIYAFFKAFTQILILAGPVSLLAAVSVGLVMRLIVNTAWNYNKAVLLGVLSMPILPKEIVNQLLNCGSPTRHNVVLLEGEAIVGFASFIVAFHVTILNIDQYVIHWYQFFSVTLRLLLTGPVVGVGFGYFGCFLIRIMSPDKIRVLFVTVTIPFVVFYTTTEIFQMGGGSLAVIVVGILMGKERVSLPTELNEFLLSFWHMLFHMFVAIVYIRIGIYTALNVFVNIEEIEIVYGFLAYLILNGVRFLSYLLFTPILRRLGYGLSFNSLVICIWGGLRSPIGIFYAITYLALYQKERKGLVRELMPYLFVMVYLSLLINGSFSAWILKLLGFYEISVASNYNMNNCIRYLMERRDRAIAVLKMDRFLAITNWPEVMKCTSLAHPYDKKLEDIPDDDDYYTGYRYTICPDCKKEILNEPTPDEFEEMKRVARNRLLKTKKRCYSHQFEQGMVSKAGIRILKQAVDIALDIEQELIELKVLIRAFEKEGFLLGKTARSEICTYFRKHSTDLIPERHQFGRHVKDSIHDIIGSMFFHAIIYVVIAINIIETSLEIVYMEHLSDGYLYALTGLNTACVCYYILELILKTWSLSINYLFISGIKSYFSSKWNTFKFILIILGVLDIMITYAHVYLKMHGVPYNYDLYLRYLRLLRFVTIIHHVSFLFPGLTIYLEERVDNQMAFAYELGKSFIDTTDDLLEILPYMIEHNIIRQDFRRRLQQDRLIITKLLALIQKDKPWIAITVKTTQAIRSVLHAMRDTIDELKVSGWVDNSEYAKLMEAFEKQYRHIAFSLKFVRPTSAEVIFKEVCWMGGEDQIINFLFENAELKKFSSGDLVIAEGQVAPGIYILVSGLFMMSYKPRSDVIDMLEKYGCLPIVEYLPGFAFKEHFDDYIVSGNTVGELCVLTGRRYNCTITAEAHSQAYLLRRHIIQKALMMNSDSIHGLECRLWHACATRLTLPVLTEHQAFQNTLQEEIKYDLEMAMVPQLARYKIFEVTEFMKHIVLIQGVVKDFVTDDIFVAPCYIPRTTKKLILLNTSDLNITDVETKLLIIPEKDVAKCEFKLSEHDSDKMLTKKPSFCLQHLIERRNKEINQRYIWSQQRVVDGSCSTTDNSSAIDSSIFEDSVSIYIASDGTKKMK